MSSKYLICSDLIEVAGSDALRRLGEEGNTLWINIEELEQKADDPKNKDSDQFRDALQFIEKGKFDTHNQQVILPTGGILKFGEDCDEDVTRVTKKTGVYSSMKRKGIPVEKPGFLRYGYDALEDFILDVHWNHPREELTPGGLEEHLGRELVNNQILRINDSEIMALKYPVKNVNKKGRYLLDESNPYLESLPEYIGTDIKDFEPRNLEQKIGTWQLLDPTAEVHFIIGGSGSGKTVLAYATAISQILGTEKNRKKTGQGTPDNDDERSVYEGILLFKSNDQIGGKDRDEGFRPGSDYDKALPFVQSFMDAHTLCGLSSEIPFEQLLRHPEKELGDFPKRTAHKINQGYLPARNPAIEVAHLRFARGRTFEEQIVFVDEAQNYTPYEMKQLIERVGVGSKLYIVGDPESQIDNPKLDENFNGLTFSLNMLYGTHPRTTLTVLDENYRSQAAEISRGRKAPKT